MENFNKYLGIYTTSGDVQTAINEGTLKKPYVALVDGVLDYNTISPEIDYTTMPLTFEITGDGNIYWYVSDSSYTKTIEYSKNGGEWTSITSTTEGVTIPVVSGDTVQFRGNNENYGSENSINNSFNNTTAQFKVKGNIMSLINSTNFGTLTTLESAYTFVQLFFNCTGLTDASNLVLPATTLADACYGFMFYGCSSLTTAPSLPATTLVFGCYGAMFQGCTSLTTAPELPATTLADSCYSGMFQDCTSLNYIKCLATDKSANDCTYVWVYGVSSTGTFVKAASTNWSRGSSSIPAGWTVEEE